MEWFAVVGVAVAVIGVIGLIVTFFGLYSDSEAVIETGAVLFAVPVLTFIVTFGVLTLIHAIWGVDFGYPIN